MEISEVVDRDSLEKWLEDKPFEWARAIAARAALRVAPLAWSVAVHEGFAEAERHKIILLTFRAVFISWTKRAWPRAHETHVFGSSAAQSIDIYIEKHGITQVLPELGFATHAASRAVFAADAQVTAAGHAADATSAAVDAANIHGPIFVAAGGAGGGAIDIWESVRLDCQWLETANTRELENVPFENLSKDQAIARELMRQPLWMKMGMPDTLPDWAKKEFAAFNHSDLAKTTSFGLITDWYRAVLRGGQSPFDEKAEIAIAQMSRSDWGDGDDPRDCIAVMNRVAKIAGWRRSYDGVVDDGEPTPPELRPASVSPIWQGEVLFNDITPLTSEMREDQGLLAIQSLRDEMLGLSADVSAEGNIDKRPAEYLQKTAELIPERMPDAKTLFALMRREQVLLGFRHNVNEQWPDFLSSRHNTMSDELTLALDQFRERREFERAKSEIAYDTIDSEDAHAAVTDTLEVMRSELGKSKIDESVPATIRSISLTGTSELPVSAELDKVRSLDELESLNNVMKQLALRSNENADAKELLRQLNEEYNAGMREGAL